MKTISNRILVLDDDPDIGIMIKLMLEYHGYAVLVTQRAEKATLLIANEDFDLLIMDMLLSGVNGIDICSRLKKNSTTVQLPVIMISAHPNAKEICINAGANDFIAKPFDMDELLSKINRFVPLPGK
jgi:DNA-binding response OmpR family regulator